MGGEVLELLTDRLERAERLEREAEARGLERGIEQGIERGIEQGIAQGYERGRFAAYAGLVQEGAMSEADAASRLGITPERFSELLLEASTSE